jgi:fatty acid desaturase
MNHHHHRYLVIAFINHNTEDAWNLQERVKAKDWAEAQLCASSDIGRDETFASSAAYLWLNFHTVHHLFPHTDMSKHPGIAKVLEQCASDYGLSYSTGKYVPQLYGEMMEAFRTPMDLIGLLVNIHL